jgi:hypothetical protein
MPKPAVRRKAQADARLQAAYDELT